MSKIAIQNSLIDSRIKLDLCFGMGRMMDVPKYPNEGAMDGFMFFFKTIK